MPKMPSFCKTLTLFLDFFMSAYEISSKKGLYYFSVNFNARGFKSMALGVGPLTLSKFCQSHLTGHSSMSKKSKDCYAANSFVYFCYKFSQ